MNEQIKKELRLIRYFFILQVLLSLANLVRGDDTQLALADRQQFASESWPQLYYVSLEAIAEDDRGDVATALNLIVPSTSRQVIVERCLPIQVAPTLYRLNLADLQWPTATFRRVIAEHPYSHTRNPIVIRADWLLLQLSDAQESPAYYSLLFGEETNREGVFDLLGVDSRPDSRFGMIEGQSGVNVAGKRWIENRALPRGYAWLTRDSIKLTGDNDMLERPDGSFKHDGEEAIVGIRKVHLSTGTQGALQVYFLANGDGKLVARAPVDLVVDSTGFRGLAEIRCPGSCIQCHEAGINPLHKNELKQYIQAGVETYADYENQQLLDSFHFADLAQELSRNAEDFQSIAEIVTGVDAKTAVACFRSAIQNYDRALDLAQVATELQSPPEELRLALAWASANGYPLPARVAGLAHGQSISRPAFEEHFLTCREIYSQWSLTR